MRRLSAAACALAGALVACTGTPSPLAPQLSGPVGLPHFGVLTEGASLPQRGDHFVRYRTDGVRWGTPRLVGTIQRAAQSVDDARPGSPRLVVADLSLRGGGKTERHRSHRTGRDADLLLYVTTADGRPVQSPGFIRFGADGLAKGQEGGRDAYFRLDVERQWLLVKALLTDPDSHVQWMFVARWLEAMLIEYARARGEDLELVWRAETVLRQPSDSATHDDHIHLRLACTPDEAVAGCSGGPRWPWLPPLPALDSPSDEVLVRALLEDIDGEPG